MRLSAHVRRLKQNLPLGGSARYVGFAQSGSLFDSGLDQNQSTLR